MSSISTFETPLLSIRDLSLVFSLSMTTHQTWRDVFTHAVRNPWQFISADKDRLQVANGISFDVFNGERVGLIGINGSGKTSLCRCIAGMYKPTRGTITAQGEVRAIFDTQFGIQPELTGKENAYLLAAFLYPKLGAKEARAAVEEALDFSELGRFVDVPFRLYSKGMQARLCLSLISSRPTELLILDEVFEGADAFFSKKIAQRVLKMIEASGAAIFVSHSEDQIRQVCNRVLVLHGAKIIFDGPPLEALECYRTLEAVRAQGTIQRGQGRLVLA